ncbi:Transcription intermediary factor 1-alpha [Mactra antiquata]
MVSRILCEICEIDEDQYLAFGYCKNCDNYLCEDCFKYHRKPKPARDHVLLNKDQMPQPAERTSAATREDVCTETCQRHENEIATFYCANHDEFFCNPCAATTHKKCDFLYIPDASKNFNESEEVKKAFNDLEEIEKACDKNTELARNNTNESDKQLNTTKKTIKNYLETIQKTLQDKADKVFTKMDEINSENETNMNNVLTDCDNTKKSSSEWSAKLKELVDNKQFCQLFIESKKAKKVIAALDASITNIQSENKIQEQKCQIDKRLMQLVTSSSLFICIDPNDKSRIFPIYQGVIVKKRESDNPNDVPDEVAPGIPPPDVPPPDVPPPDMPPPNVPPPNLPPVPPRKNTGELSMSFSEEEENLYEAIDNLTR